MATRWAAGPPGGDGDNEPPPGGGAGGQVGTAEAGGARAGPGRAAASRRGERLGWSELNGRSLPLSLPPTLPARPPRSCWELGAGSGAVPQQRRGGSRPAERSPRSGYRSRARRRRRRLRCLTGRAAAPLPAPRSRRRPRPGDGGFPGAAPWAPRPPGPLGRAWRVAPTPNLPGPEERFPERWGIRLRPCHISIVVIFSRDKGLASVCLYPVLATLLSAGAYVKDISIRSICCWNDPLCLVQKLNSMPYGGTSACFDLQDKVFNAKACLILLGSLLIVMSLKQLLTLDSKKCI